MSTNEQEKFNAWWDLKGTNSVILRAQAWSAWLARAEAEQQAVCDECGGSGEVDSGGFTPWMAPINVPCGKCSQPQPQKTRVRLWVSQSAVIVRDAHETGFGKEIHHDSEGFYVEGGQL